MGVPLAQMSMNVTANMLFGTMSGCVGDIFVEDQMAVFLEGTMISSRTESIFWCSLLCLSLLYLSLVCHASACLVASDVTFFCS